MSDFGNKVKQIWMKGMEAVGNTASNIASNTKYKVDEMNLINRRRELLSDISAKSYTLWQKGTEFPEPVNDMLKQLSSIDEQLNDLRAERLSGVETENEDETDTVETDAAVNETEDTAAQGAVQEEKPENGGSSGCEIPVIEVKEAVQPEEPVPATEEQTEINARIDELFDKVPSVDDMAEKVNGVLDSLGDSIRKFTSEIDHGIDELDKKINDKKDDE